MNYNKQYNSGVVFVPNYDESLWIGADETTGTILSNWRKEIENSIFIYNYVDIQRYHVMEYIKDNLCKVKIDITLLEPSTTSKNYSIITSSTYEEIIAYVLNNEDMQVYLKLLKL